MPVVDRRFFLATLLGLSVAEVVSAVVPKPVLQKSAKPQFVSPHANLHSTFVMDDGGRILHNNHGDTLWAPASTTKLMTAYLVLEKIKAGTLKLDQPIKISATAAHQKKTNIHLHEDDSITVMEALQAMIVHSANDCAMALAEHIAGSEVVFVQHMNKKAKTLGMLHTNFCTPNGLPADRQLTTAHDMALLMHALHRDFSKLPQCWNLFREPSFTYHHKKYHRSDGKIMYPGLKYKSVSGITIEADKTGYTHDSKCNIVALASHNGRRIIAVVMGSPSRRARQDALQYLIEAAFQTPAPALKPIPSRPHHAPNFQPQHKDLYK